MAVGTLASPLADVEPDPLQITELRLDLGCEIVPARVQITHESPDIRSGGHDGIHPVPVDGQMIHLVAHAECALAGIENHQLRLLG